LVRVPSRSPRSFSTAASVRAALQRYARATQAVCAEHGLTPAQYELLLSVRGLAQANGPISVKEIARHLELAENGVAERVRRAEAAGLLERERDPADGRVALIQLSHEGERRFARAFAGLAAESDLLIATIGEIDRG
jgi:DNA-binding MarR family transcriptional regulator